jgi:chemotaxis family two-component system sensor kinase Cph1
MVDLQDVLGETLFHLQAAIRDTGATVSSDPLPPVPGRRAQLVQLFQNIVGNAIKYRSAAPPRIHIGVQPAEGRWVLAIRDNGIGIDIQYAETVFHVFKRLHSDREYPGTGIGLAACKRIVEIHRGSIWVESELGKGTTFFVSLPAFAANTGSLELTG